MLKFIYLSGLGAIIFLLHQSSALARSIAVDPVPEEWISLSQTIHCEAMICKAEAGIGVDYGGHYVIGPGRAGRRTEGTISKHELEVLRRDANAVIHTLDTSPNRCEAMQWSPIGGGVDLQVIRLNKVVVPLMVTGSIHDKQTCRLVGTGKLSATLVRLLEKYYPPD